MASNTQDKNRISLSINAFLSGLIDQQLRKKTNTQKLKEVNFFIFFAILLPLSFPNVLLFATSKSIRMI